jgi:hypothetical protein
MIPFAGFAITVENVREHSKADEELTKISEIAKNVYFDEAVNKFVYRYNNKFYNRWIHDEYWGYTDTSTSPNNIIPHSN